MHHAAGNPSPVIHDKQCSEKEVVAIVAMHTIAANPFRPEFLKHVLLKRTLQN